MMFPNDVPNNGIVDSLDLFPAVQLLARISGSTRVFSRAVTFDPAGLRSCFSERGVSLRESPGVLRNPLGHGCPERAADAAVKPGVLAAVGAEQIRLSAGRKCAQPSPLPQKAFTRLPSNGTSMS
jgi:hypothetical protein